METDIVQLPLIRIFCLNRTMQYGNSVNALAPPEAWCGLNRTMQYGNFEAIQFFDTRAERFKSYYVVWKQQEWKEIDDGKDGLNRTMQYGNLESMRHRFEECFV